MDSRFTLIMSESDRGLLDLLAEQQTRSKGGVIRWLIRQAALELPSAVAECRDIAPKTGVQKAASENQRKRRSTSPGGVHD